jgi:hypothetical protein
MRTYNFNKDNAKEMGAKGGIAKGENHDPVLAKITKTVTKKFLDRLEKIIAQNHYKEIIESCYGVDVLTGKVIVTNPELLLRVRKQIEERFLGRPKETVEVKEDVTLKVISWKDATSSRVRLTEPEDPSDTPESDLLG